MANESKQNPALAALMREAEALVEQGLAVGLVGMDEATAEWVEMQRKVSAQQRGGQRVMITGGGGNDASGKPVPFTQSKRKWTTTDELSRIIKANKATDPHAGGGSGPRGEFNASTGTWD